MRPAIPHGEVFATVHDGGNDDAVECRFYRAVDSTAPGRPVIAAVRLLEHLQLHSASDPINTPPTRIEAEPLQPTAIENEPLLPRSQELRRAAPVPPPPPGAVKFKCGAQRERVLGVTAIAFFGIREDADGLITLRGEEVEAARMLAETGHFKTNVAGMRRTPLGNTPLNAPIVADSLASKASPTAVNVAPVRSIRRRGHFANQVKALIYKDFLVMKASKWAFWCELGTVIFMLLVVAMLLLFIVCAPMMKDDLIHEPKTHWDGKVPGGSLWKTRHAFSKTTPSARC